MAEKISGLEEFFQLVKEGREGHNIGLSTGSPKLDLYTDGVLPGTSYLIGGASGSGKSTWALWTYVYQPLIHYLNGDSPERDPRWLLFSLEMTRSQVYAKLVSISPDFVDVSIKALKNNEDILTDINMVKSGITQYEGNVKCYIKDEKVKDLAKKLSEEKPTTRAAAAIQYAANTDFEGIIAIGNAPTALFKAIELKQSGELNVKSIIGVPVGFVGAADSKEALKNTNIPNIITNGPKGGTPIAVACANSLIQNCKD